METVRRLLNPSNSRIAIQAPDRIPLTHAALEDHVECTGDRLRELGAGRGDRIVSVLANGADAAAAIPAICSHATLVPIDPNATRTEYDALFRVLEPKMLLISAGSEPAAIDAATASGIPIVEADPQDEAGKFVITGRTGYVPATASDVEPDDYAYILQTSGTSGNPKLAPMTHRGACSAAAAIVDSLSFRSDDTCLLFTPLFHSLGVVSGVLVPLSSGGCTTVLAGFAPHEFFAALSGYQATWFPVVPALLTSIMEHATNYREEIARSSLRIIRPGGAPLSRDLIARVEAHWAGASLKSTDSQKHPRWPAGRSMTIETKAAQ